MDYVNLGIRFMIMAVVVYVTTGQIKSLLRLYVRWRRDKSGPLGKIMEEALRWGTRTTAPLLGIGLSLIPKVWPELPTVWSIFLGAAAGALAVPIYHSLERAPWASALGGPSLFAAREEIAEEP